MRNFARITIIFLSLKQYAKSELFRNFVIRIDDLVERLESAAKTNKAAEENIANFTSTVEQLKQDNADLKTNNAVLKERVSMMQNMLNGMSIELYCIVIYKMYNRLGQSNWCQNSRHFFPPKIELIFIRLGGSGASNGNLSLASYFQLWKRWQWRVLVTRMKQWLWIGKNWIDWHCKRYMGCIWRL